MLLLILAEQWYYLFLSIFLQMCLFHHLHLYFVMASSSFLSWQQQQQYYNLHNILFACIYSFIFYLIVKIKTHFFQQPFYNINDDDVVASDEADANGIFIKEEDDFWCQIKTSQQKKQKHILFKNVKIFNCTF
jgi:hypothetical protein